MGDRVLCRTPDGDNPGTKMPVEKYTGLEVALRQVLAEGPMKQVDLTDPVTRALSAKDRDMIGSVRWHMTWVRLEMEVRGQISRRPGKPVRVQLTEQS